MCVLLAVDVMLTVKLLFWQAQSDKSSIPRTPLGHHNTHSAVRCRHRPAAI